jgi:hypothetical protein
MAEMEQAWERLLDYRERVRGWVQGEVSLADTRLRVARLLDAGFGFGWDDLEADVETMGHRADFALRIDGRRWGVVLVRPMGSGAGEGAPSEAFVLADGAGVHWTWVTDGVTVAVWHVDPDLVARPVASLNLLGDTEGALKTVWERLCRDGIRQGRLDTHRLSLLRPDAAAIRQALQSPAVLAALRQTLLGSFPEPGSTDDLAASLADLLDGDDDWQPADAAVPPTASPTRHPPGPPDRPEAPPVAAAPTPSPTVVLPPPPAPAVPPPAKGAPAPVQPHRNGRPEPVPDTLLTAMEKQRQTHERLRQNLQDLRDNRARLQDALVELQRDYPDRLERLATPKVAEPVGAGAKPASWTLLGHLQSMGNGYWEWSAADEGGPGVRLN